MKSNQFFSVTVVYFFGFVFSKLLVILLLPLYTAYIPVRDFGQINYADTLLNFLFPIAYLQVWSAILRFLYHKKDADNANVISNGFFIFILSSVVYTILFIGLVKFNYIESYAIYIYIYGITTVLHYIYGIIARGLGYNKLYACTGIVMSVIVVISNIILFMLIKHMDYKAFFISNILANIAQIIIIEYKLKVVQYIHISSMKIGVIFEMLKFSFPLSVNDISYWFLSGYNVIMITNALGLSAAGVYAIGMKFSSILLMLSGCFTLAWQEMVYSLSSEKRQEREKRYKFVSAYLLQLLVILQVALLVIIKYTFDIFISKEYYSSYQLIPLSLFATSEIIYMSFIANIFNAEKDNSIILYANTTAAVVNVGIFYLIIQNVGLQSANISLSVSMFICNLMLYIKLIKFVGKVGINLKKVLTYLILLLGAYYCFMQGTVVDVLLLLCLLGWCVYEIVPIDYFHKKTLGFLEKIDKKFN